MTKLCNKHYVQRLLWIHSIKLINYSKAAGETLFNIILLLFLFSSKFDILKSETF